MSCPKESGPQESALPATTVLGPLREALAACRPAVQVRPRSLPPPLPRAAGAPEGQQLGEPGRSCLFPGCVWDEGNHSFPGGSPELAEGRYPFQLISASRSKCAMTSGGG